MQWRDISFTPPERTLRQFAGLWLFFLGTAAAVQGVFRHNLILTAVLGTLAVTIGLAGLVRPSMIRPIFVGSMILTFPIGWTVNKIVLACMFYGIFTPIAVLFRMIGRDGLSRRRRPKAESYWLVKSQPADPSSYLRPF
jgi:Saxitoxin biosynthesis operon protein SxtJ